MPDHLGVGRVLAAPPRTRSRCRGSGSARAGPGGAGGRRRPRPGARRGRPVPRSTRSSGRARRGRPCRGRRRTGSRTARAAAGSRRAQGPAPARRRPRRSARWRPATAASRRTVGVRKICEGCTAAPSTASRCWHSRAASSELPPSSKNETSPGTRSVSSTAPEPVGDQCRGALERLGGRLDAVVLRADPRGQLPPVDLAVRQLRELLEELDASRHQVLRQQLGEPLAQLLGSGAALAARVEQREPVVRTVGLGYRHDRGAGHRGHPLHGALHLGGLDPVAPDLDLAVAAAGVVEHALPPTGCPSRLSGTGVGAPRRSPPRRRPPRSARGRRGSRGPAPGRPGTARRSRPARTPGCRPGRTHRCARGRGRAGCRPGRRSPRAAPRAR